MYQIISDIASKGNIINRPTKPQDLDGIQNPLLEHPIISPANIPGYGSRLEDDCPAIPKGLTQEQRNTDHLIEVFANWAIFNAPHYRRFVVVTSVAPLPRWQKWHHIELLHGPQACYKKYGIKPEQYREKYLSQSSSSSSSSTARPDGANNKQPSSLQGSPKDIMSPT